MYKGNVVKWPDKKDLYIVVETSFTGCPSKRKNISKIKMIPFSGSNCTIIISREHPSKKWIDDPECAYPYHDPQCTCKAVIDEDRTIDALVYVADCVQEFINERLKKLMFEV